jgi:hypothetical protein
MRLFQMNIIACSIVDVTSISDFGQTNPYPRMCNVTSPRMKFSVLSLHSRTTRARSEANARSVIDTSTIDMVFTRFITFR